MVRKKTRKIRVGNVYVGGDAPISVQSMTNTITKDTESTIRQILSFEKRGCDISRSAINDFDDANCISIIKRSTNIPFIADIQFDYKLAIAAVKNGADCLRINPGNIGGKNKLKEVINCCDFYGIPVRIGVNGGSIHKKYLDMFGGLNSDSIVNSALDELDTVESFGFNNIKIAVKSSDVSMTIDSYKKISKVCDYPLHIGVTEAGPSEYGIIKSSLGIGALLSEGIGDTIRVSLTESPEKEVEVGIEMLKYMGLRTAGVEIISCPTCSRTLINLIDIVHEVKIRLMEENINKDIKIAIMGCPVNGPGEAKDADIGISGGNGSGILFSKGKLVKQIKESEIINELIANIKLFDTFDKKVL